MQRARLVAAAAGLLAEDGYEATSAAAICARAGVSRRTFYELFDNREECVAAILRDGERRIANAIAAMDLAGASWRERMRMGLWATLCLAEADPALAQVFLLESQSAGGRVRDERRRIIARFVRLVDEGRTSHGGSGSAPGALTAEALVGAVCAVLTTRIADAQPGARVGGNGPADLRDLLGELTGMIVLPYLGAAAARRELTRALPATPAALDGECVAAGPDPLAGLPIRLTYRTARVLIAVQQLALAEAGASNVTSQLGRAESGASNRQIARHAGISDPGQTSKLLSRLARHGLLTNAVEQTAGRGDANSWRLTSAGQRLVRGITTETAGAA